MCTRSRRAARAALVLAALALAAAGCSRKESYQVMAHEPRYNPLAESHFFADRRSARELVPGTVARGHLDDDELRDHGTIGGKVADVFPFPVTADVLRRGQQRFDIYCSPCHDRTAGGNGMVVRRGFMHPPSLYDPRLRQAPAGLFFQVMTQGYGAMPEYAKQISPDDRWAIVAYIRALQLSEHATLADVPPAERAKLTAEATR